MKKARAITVSLVLAFLIAVPIVAFTQLYESSCEPIALVSSEPSGGSPGRSRMNGH